MGSFSPVRGSPPLTRAPDNPISPFSLIFFPSFPVKSLSRLFLSQSLSVLAVGAAVALPARAADAPAGHDHDHGAAAAPAAAPVTTGRLIPVDARTDAAWLAKARAAYPLETCAVSDEKLGGSMGPAPEFIYREAGKADQLVRFCCKSCVSDFTKDPAKYLKVINDAAATKAKAPVSGK